MFVGCHASKILRSAIPVEGGDRVTSNSTDARNTDEVGIMLALGNGQAGIRSSPPKKVMGLIAQFCPIKVRLH